MNRKEDVALDEILDDIMLQESEPNHEALLRWCNKYPEHREALTRFFATWAVQIERGDVAAVDENRVASKMVSHALNLIYQERAQAPAGEKVSLPSRLYRMIKLSTKSQEQLMAACNLDESLFAKLDRHLIFFESIPRLCLEKLSIAFQCAIEDVSRVLVGDPIPLAQHKAKSKPALRQETFLEAVASSDLSDAEKEAWKQVISGEAK